MTCRHCGEERLVEAVYGGLFCAVCGRVSRLTGASAPHAGNAGAPRGSDGGASDGPCQQPRQGAR